MRKIYASRVVVYQLESFRGRVELEEVGDLNGRFDVWVCFFSVPYHSVDLFRIAPDRIH